MIPATLVDYFEYFHSTLLYHWHIQIIEGSNHEFVIFFWFFLFIIRYSIILYE